MDQLPDLLPSWKVAFRNGVLPLLDREQLQTLRKLLQNDDPRLLQGATTTPPPLMCVQDWPVEAACFLGMCGWSKLTNGDLDEVTVGEVEEFFARLCYDVDAMLDEPAGVRHFLNWYDETPRDEMRRELLAEIELAIK